MEKEKGQLIVFSDIDGTLNLQNLKEIIRLKHAILKLQINGGLFIPVTGRSIEDAYEIFKKIGVMPNYIVGDNGAVIYDVMNKKIIYKEQLEFSNTQKILEKFIRTGGKVENIRFTNEKGIFAQENEKVQKYYKDNKKARMFANILEPDLRKKEGITKITLVGEKEEIEEMEKYIREEAKMKCFVHKGRTTFPNKKTKVNKEEKKWRIDITNDNISKGYAIKRVLKKFNPDNFLFIGNDLNDIKGFEETIKHKGGTAMVIKDKEIYEDILKYRKGEVIFLERLGNKDIAHYILNTLSSKQNERYKQNKQMQYKER